MRLRRAGCATPCLFVFVNVDCTTRIYTLTVVNTQCLQYLFYFLLKVKKTTYGMYEGESKQSAHPKILTRHDRATGSEIPGSSTGLYKNI